MNRRSQSRVIHFLQTVFLGWVAGFCALAGVTWWRVPPGPTPELLLPVGHSDDVDCVAWSAEDKTLASGGFDTTIKLWEASRGQLLRTLSDHSDRVPRNLVDIDTLN